MAFQTLQAEIDADASGFTSGVEDASDSADDLSSKAAGLKDSLVDINPAGLAAGGALATLGTGMQTLLDKNQDLNETLGRTGESMGLTTDETRELARGMQNASFPMDDVVGTMDILARQGVETEEEMQEVAETMDSVADATGTTATAVAENAGPAIRAFGGDLSDASEHADTFTFIARNTTMSVEDFSSNIERMAPELQEMGMSLDDTAALMAALEEKGITGRQAITEFRQATNNADGDQQELMRQLGLTESEIRAQEAALSDAEGITRAHSEAANDSLTTMDHLRARFESAQLAASGMLGPVSAAAPAFQAVGAAAMFASVVNVSALIPSIVGIMTALTPLLPILLGIGVIVGGLVYAWHKGWIDPVETATWAAGKLIDGLTWLKDVIWKYSPMLRAFRKVWESNFLGIQDTVSTATDMVGDAIDWIVEKINKIPGVDIGGGDVDVSPPSPSGGSGGSTDDKLLSAAADMGPARPPGSGGAGVQSSGGGAGADIASRGPPSSGGSREVKLDGPLEIEGELDIDGDTGDLRGTVKRTRYRGGVQ